MAYVSTLTKLDQRHHGAVTALIRQMHEAGMGYTPIAAEVSRRYLPVSSTTVARFVREMKAEAAAQAAHDEESVEAAS